LKEGELSVLERSEVKIIRYRGDTSLRKVAEVTLENTFSSVTKVDEGRIEMPKEFSDEP